MKLKKAAALLCFIPAIASGASHDVKLTVKGVAYKSCTVGLAGTNQTLEIGTRKSSQWMTGQTYLQDGERYISFTLTDCDTGTTIKVSAEGAEGTRNWWLANDAANGAPDLQAALGVVPPDGVGFKFLYPGDKSRTYTYTTSSSTSETIKIVSSMRREDTSIKPAGKFSTTVTIYFTFS